MKTNTQTIIDGIKWTSTVTPRGEALWVKILEPDYKFDKKDGKYEATLLLDPSNPETDEWVTKVNNYLQHYSKVIKETLAPRKQEELRIVNPLPEQYDKEDNLTGKLVLKTKTKGAFKDEPITIPVYDAVGEKIEGFKKLIGNGSIIKLFVSFKPYYTSGSNSLGLTFKLKKVQVIKLNEFSGDGDNVFGDESSNGDFTTKGDEEDF